MSEVSVCELPEEVRKYAKEVLNETKESRSDGFEQIKKWAQENPNLHVRTEEKYILPFLRSCKFDIEKTKEKMKNFYIMRGERTEWFLARDPTIPAIQELVKMGSSMVLRKLQQNHLVVLIKATVHDPNVYSLDTVLKTALMIVDVATVEDELSQIYGVICIIDMKNVSFDHGKQLSISRIKNLTHAWQNYYCRPKKIIFINAPGYINALLNVFKSFLSAKMKSRIYIYSDGISSLKDNVDDAVLPEDYGGESESTKELANYWLNKLYSLASWFVEDEKFKADLVPR